MNKGNSYYDLLKVFDIHDTMYSETLIEQYFKNIEIIYIYIINEIILCETKQTNLMC